MGGLNNILSRFRVAAAVALVVVNAGEARAGAFFETGQRTLSTTVDRGGWVHVSLTKPFVNPVVVTGPLTHRNDASLSVRVRDVSPTGFDIGMQSPCESAGSAGRGVQCPPAGGYTSEEVVYWVVEAGAWVFPDGREIEAGIHRTATVRSNQGGGTNNSSDTITFLRQSFSATPGLFHTVNSVSGGSGQDWITTGAWGPGMTRRNLIATTGFQVALEGGEVTNTHSAEDIGWVAIDTGSGTNHGISYIAGSQAPLATPKHDQGCASAGSAAGRPFVVAALNSMTGNDGGWLRQCGAGFQSGSLLMHAEEDQARDKERRGTDERVAWFAMSGSGFGLLDFLTATQTAVDVNGGNLGPGDVVAYTVTIRNLQTDFAQMDNSTPEAIIPLPANALLVAGSLGASVGTLTENAAAGRLEWNGVVAPGATVVLSYQLQVDIAQSVCGTVVSTQAELWMDANRDGSNSIRELSDDTAASDGVDSDADGFLSDDDPNRILIVCGPPLLDLDADDSSGATGSEFRATYAGVPVPVADVDVTITDADSAQIQDAVVQIFGAVSGDRLSLAGPLPSGIAAVFSSQNRLLSLSGAASLADYETALALVRFDSAAASPSGTRLILSLVRDQMGFPSNSGIARISLDVPRLSIEQSNSPTTAAPGDVVDYLVDVRSVGDVPSDGVVLSDQMSPYCALGVDTFGTGLPFRLTDAGSGLTIATIDYADSSGFGYTPVSGGGNAPPGYDASVEQWRIEFTGSISGVGNGFSIEYSCIVE